MSSLRSIERVRVPTPSELDWLRAELVCDGFALIPAVLPRDLTDRLSEEVMGLARRAPAAGDAGWGDGDGGRVASSWPGFGQTGELAEELVHLQPLVTLAQALLGVECLPLRAEYFASPGRVGGPTRAWQDQAFHGDGVTGELAVTLWCSLSDVGADDGVMEYAFPNALPGQLLEHVETPAPHGGCELPDPDRFAFRPVALRCGDVVAHHAYTVRRSGANRSGRPSGAIAVSYQSSAPRTWPRP